MPGPATKNHAGVAEFDRIENGCRKGAIRHMAKLLFAGTHFYRHYHTVSAEVLVRGRESEG